MGVYWQGSITIIDLPQAVDPRPNSNALILLMRDIENICQYMNHHGLERDSERIAERLWRGFK
jgi:serine/threonine-protein kinase RIO1